MQIPHGQIVFAFFTLPHSFHSNFSARSFSIIGVPCLSCPLVAPYQTLSSSTCRVLWAVCIFTQYICDICQDARRANILSGPRLAAMVAVTVSLSGAALEPWLMIAGGWQRCFSFSRTHSAHVDEHEGNENTFNPPFSLWEIEQNPVFSRGLRGGNIFLRHFTLI